MEDSAQIERPKIKEEAEQETEAKLSIPNDPLEPLRGVSTDIRAGLAYQERVDVEARVKALEEQIAQREANRVAQAAHTETGVDVQPQVQIAQIVQVDAIRPPQEVQVVPSQALISLEQ